MYLLKIEKCSSFILQRQLIDIREDKDLPAKFQGKLLHGLWVGVENE